MKTIFSVHINAPSSSKSEAYLEGMKTYIKNVTQRNVILCPKPTSKEWKQVTDIRAIFFFF